MPQSTSPDFEDSSFEELTDETTEKLGSVNEPYYDAQRPCEQIDLIHALNWYQANLDDGAAAKILGVPVSIAKDFRTLAWATRMRKRGFTFSKRNQETYQQMRERFELAKTSANRATV